MTDDTDAITVGLTITSWPMPRTEYERGWNEALAAVRKKAQDAARAAPQADAGLRGRLLTEFDGSVCPACHHRAHDPGGCSECPRCELHTDEAMAFVLRYEPDLAASPATPAGLDVCPDTIGVDNWPGGGGRVSKYDDATWVNDAGGAWVLLYAPVQFYDGLRRRAASQTSEDGPADET